MGGRGSTRLAIKHPHLFCSLFNQAGNVPRTAEMGTMLGDAPGWDASRTATFLNGYLGPDRAHYEDNDVFLLLKKNALQIRGKMRILSACGTCVRLLPARAAAPAAFHLTGAPLLQGR
jgi:S-formylglutathione hydrolase FrmB